MWIPSLKLTVKHKEILEKKWWLDDCIINCAQKMLRQQFTGNDGLRSTVLVAAKQDSTLGGGAIQILHVRTNHWLCISVNDDKSVVNVYDSKYPSPILATVDLIIDLIKSEQDAITINSIKMQQQVGDDACGGFALAVATTLCQKEDPSTIQWNQDLMWQHIQDCFESGKMTQFPLIEYNNENKGKIKSTKTYELYCICRKRYKATDTMKRCVKCMKWYHTSCITNHASLKYKAFHCSFCSN